MYFDSPKYAVRQIPKPLPIPYTFKYGEFFIVALAEFVMEYSDALKLCKTVIRMSGKPQIFSCKVIVE